MSWKEETMWNLKDSIQRPQVPRILKSTFEQSTSRYLVALCDGVIT